jgi:hypothetical protein
MMIPTGLLGLSYWVLIWVIRVIYCNVTWHELNEVLHFLAFKVEGSHKVSVHNTLPHFELFSRWKGSQFEVRSITIWPIRVIRVLVIYLVLKGS